jgi:hypothetical protein
MSKLKTTKYIFGDNKINTKIEEIGNICYMLKHLKFKYKVC